jgi:bacterioferritin-associated ferredoxin
MFVCICNAVSDRVIREHASQGVTTLDELRLRTGCSDCCGQCAEEAEAILRAAHTGVSPSAQPAATLPVLRPQLA